MKKLVECKVCNKKEEVYLSRSLNYKTCSKKCSGEYRKEKNNVKCIVCGNEFHVKPIRIKRIKSGICCSKKRIINVFDFVFWNSDSGILNNNVYEIVRSTNSNCNHFKINAPRRLLQLF
jgi:hypothetical protein